MGEVHQEVVLMEPPGPNTPKEGLEGADWPWGRTGVVTTLADCDCNFLIHLVLDLICISLDQDDAATTFDLNGSLDLLGRDVDLTYFALHDYSF